MLLGALVSEAKIKLAIEAKVQSLRLVNERFTCVEPHQGLTLLNFLSIPKLHYLLRTSPAYKYRVALNEFDQLIQSTLSQFTVVRIDEKSWSQASLPVRLGGLRLR